jgi:hypothetical protein
MRLLVLGLSAVAFSLTAWSQPPRVGPQLAAQAPAEQGVKNVNSGIVLEASKSAQEDLKAIMAKVKSAQARQEQLVADRASGTRAIRPPVSLGAVASANPCAGEDVASWQACVSRVQLKLNALPMDSSQRADIALQIEALKQDLDAMSEMGEMESLKLQMAMDRLSKMQSTISNVMKKASDTSSSVIQNIK